MGTGDTQGHAHRFGLGRRQPCLIALHTVRGNVSSQGGSTNPPQPEMPAQRASEENSGRPVDGIKVGKACLTIARHGCTELWRSANT